MAGLVLRESGIANRLRRMFPQADWRRVENRVNPGTPDLNGCLRGVEIWVEAKTAERPARDDTPVHVRFEPSQPPWITRRCRAGGRVFVALTVGRQLLVVPGRHVQALAAGLPLATLEDLSIDPTTLFDTEPQP